MEFYCHEQEWGPGSHVVLCKGFLDAFTAKLRNGDYDRLPKWKSEMYVAMLDAIDKAEQGEHVYLLKMIRELPVTV